MFQILYKNKYALSNKTVTSRNCHLNLFRLNNIQFENYDSVKDNPNKIIDKMIDTKGKLLKNGYKAQIAMTLKAIHPNLKINIKNYKEKAKTETRVEDPEFIKKINTLADDCAKRINLVSEYAMIDLGEYESCLTVIISLATTMRLSEIIKMKMFNLKEILEQKMVSVSPKGHDGTRFIPINTILLYLVKSILINRDKVELFLNNSRRKLDKKRKKKFKDNFVITSSASYLKKKIKELAALSLLYIPVLGYKPFRKLTTTILISKGGLDVASAMNNHSNINTTEKYYNITSGAVLEKVYSSINDVINQNNASTNTTIPTQTESRQTDNQAENNESIETVFPEQKNSKQTNEQDKTNEVFMDVDVEQLLVPNTETESTKIINENHLNDPNISNMDINLLNLSSVVFTPQHD